LFDVEYYAASMVRGCCMAVDAKLAGCRYHLVVPD
jgi:hypothetical protein